MNQARDVDVRRDSGSPDVELRGVSKRYGAVAAVDGVSLKVPRGAFVTLLGPSGCGKTTTLRMIAGFETPSEGTVLIGGQDVSRVPPNARNTSMVFQDYALFPHMTVAENVAFGLKMRRVPRAEQARRVAEALALVDLVGYEWRLPAQLSGGQQQRVALARALVVRPRVLLLDEPLGALDARIRRQMQLELTDLQRRLGLTFVYVTHDQEEALTMSTLVAIMRGGRLEQVGTPEEIYRRPVTAFVASFLGDCNLLPGRVLEAGPRRATLEIQGVGVVSAATAPDRSFAAGDAVYAAVRPEHLSLGPPGGAGAGGRPASGEALILHGRLLDIQFAGPVTRYRVRVGAHELNVRASGDAGADLVPGGEVEVRWPFPSTVVLPPP
ncbi:MAG TPA: ABC transporter ATP-binding protein [Bacillota bacterium]